MLALINAQVAWSRLERWNSSTVPQRAKLFAATYVRNATYRPDVVAVHGLTAEFPADNPLFDHVASKGHLMAASNQIFLVVDAGTLVAAFTARHELKGFL
jgi:hypothetical protein